MTKVKGKKIFIASVLILFLIPGIGGTYSGIQRGIYLLNNKNRKITFAGEYPFVNADTDTDIGLIIYNKSKLLNSYFAITSKVTDYIDDYSGKNNIAAPFFLNIYGKTMDAIGKEIIDDAENRVVKLNNGYLTYGYLSSGEYTEYEGTAIFNKWLAEKNIPFMYIIPADKSDDRYAVYPQGFPKWDSDMEDRYLKYFDDNEIVYLNSREILLSENNDFFSWFYKTDHHWNVQAGFSIASETAKRLKREFGIDADMGILDRKNFNIVTYENLFLGSQGKKATCGYIAPEDFQVYYPVFETAFSIEIPTKMLDNKDTFENTLINSTFLKPGNYYTNNAYSAFLHGDVPLARVHNINCKNGTRALMIKTSDANVVDTYLAFTVEYLDIIDPRSFDGSIRTFIEMTQPDVVLTCAYPSQILDNKMQDIE